MLNLQKCISSQIIFMCAFEHYTKVEVKVFELSYFRYAGAVQAQPLQLQFMLYMYVFLFQERQCTSQPYCKGVKDIASKYINCQYQQYIA